MLPRAVPLAALPFGDPSILGHERRAGTWLRELHPQCPDVSLWQNRDASCRSGKGSLRSLPKKRRPGAQKTKLQSARSKISCPWEIARDTLSSRREFARARIWLFELRMSSSTLFTILGWRFLRSEFFCSTCCHWFLLIVV